MEHIRVSPWVLSRPLKRSNLRLARPQGLAAARVSRGVCHRGGPFLGCPKGQSAARKFCKYGENGPDNVRIKPEPLTLRFVREPCNRHRRAARETDRDIVHRHDPLGKGVPAPRLLPPCDPSARRAGTHVADTRSLEQGPGGRRPCSTSGPLGKDAGDCPLPRESNSTSCL